MAGHSDLPVSFRSQATAAGQPPPPPPPPQAATGPTGPLEPPALQGHGYEQQQSQYRPQQHAEEPFQYPLQQTQQQSNAPLCQQASGQGSFQQQQLPVLLQLQQAQPMLWYGMFGSQPGNSAGLHSFTPTHLGAQVSLQQAPASVQLVASTPEGAAQAMDEPYQQHGGPASFLEDCFRGWEQ